MSSRIARSSTLFAFLVAIASGSIVRQGCYSEEEWRSQFPPDVFHTFDRCGPSRVCTKGHDECVDFCQSDAECEGYPLVLCRFPSQTCEHKNLFEGTAGPDIGAAVMFLFISGLALAAGIGGGGLYVPLLMILLGFGVHEATALSQACLAGGASTALLYNLRQRHPSGTKPMIDYQLVLVMAPNLLAGALVGGALNPVLPSWLIVLMLTVVLYQSMRKTFAKAIQTWRKEEADQAQGSTPAYDPRLSKNPIERVLRLVTGKSRQEEPCDEEPTAVGKACPAEAGKESIESGAPPAPQLMAAAMSSHVGSTEDGHNSGSPNLEQPVDCQQVDMVEACERTPQKEKPVKGLAASQAQFPLRPLGVFAGIWAVVVVSILVRGGSASPGLVRYCSFPYWSVAVGTIAVLAVVGYGTASRVVKPADEKPMKEGEFEWTPSATKKIALWSLMAGMLAALCGIGGGMIVGPHLLELGFLPQVQAATTATTLFVVSTSTALAFVIQGTAPPDYTVFLACFTGIGAVFGKALIGWLVKRFRRPSLIMFLLGGIILASVVVMFITGFIDVVNDFRHGEGLLFSPLCSLGGEE